MKNIDEIVKEYKTEMLEKGFEEVDEEQEREFRELLLSWQKDIVSEKEKLEMVMRYIIRHCVIRPLIKQVILEAMEK